MTVGYHRIEQKPLSDYGGGFFLSEVKAGEKRAFGNRLKATGLP